MIRQILIIILLVFFLNPAARSYGASGPDQVRLKTSLALAPRDAVAVDFTFENRFDDFTLFDEHYLTAYYLTGTYRISPSWYGALGLRRQDTELATFTSHENRVYLQGGRKQRFGERLALDARLRIEYRSYEQDALDDYFRFRLRFKLDVKTGFGNMRLTPYISDELFADDQAGRREFLNRSRTLAGVVFAAGSRVGFEVSFMLEHNKDTRPLTALVAGVRIRP